MKNITKYNNLVEDIVFEYAKRLWDEEKVWEEPDNRDYHIMNYQNVSFGPINIWDRNIDLDDLLICQANNFPANSLLDWCDYEKWEEKKTNYSNYVKNLWKKNI